MKPQSKCAEPDCPHATGQPPRRNPFWCAKHDEERIERISRQLEAIDRLFEREVDDAR